MNIYKDKLEVGQVFKNYKTLCEYLGEDSSLEGNSKRSQEKEFRRCFTFEKLANSRKLEITKIHSTPLEKTSNNKGGNNRINEPLITSHPELSKEWSIDKNNMSISNNITRRTSENYWWKCGKCNHEMFQSPEERIRYCKVIKGGYTCEFCALSKGAKKIHSLLRKCELNVKMEYIFKDLKGLSGGYLRFDFVVLDENQNPLTLIEYDGEYHDEHLNPSYENYLKIAAHDRLKNDYCEKNNIPLLRIHHTYMDIHKQLLYNHLERLGILNLLLDQYTQVDSLVLDQWSKDIDDAKKKVKELQFFIDSLQDKLVKWS